MVGITRSKVIFSIVPFVACHCSLPTGLWIDASTICFQPFDDWFYGPILSEERREDIAAPWPLVDATRVPETKALDFRNLYHFEYVSIQDIDLKYPGFWCMWTANFVCSCIRMPSQQNLIIRLVFLTCSSCCFAKQREKQSTRSWNIQAFYFSAWGCEMHKSKDTSKTWGKAMYIKDGKRRILFLAGAQRLPMISSFISLFYFWVVSAI